MHCLWRSSTSLTCITRLPDRCRAIEKGQAQLCLLAEDCNQPDYKKLIEALCAEHNVNLISVPENKQLGQWCGVSNGMGWPARMHGSRDTGWPWGCMLRRTAMPCWHAGTA